MANYDNAMEDRRTPLDILIDLQEAVAKDANNATTSPDAVPLAECVPLSIMAYALEELVWRRAYEQCNRISVEGVEFHIEKAANAFDKYLLSLTGQKKAKRINRGGGTV